VEVQEFLREAVRRKASDVIISAGSPVTYYVNGILEPHDENWRLSPSEAQVLAYQVLGEDQRKTFEIERELDFGFEIEGLSRFRVSVYRQKGTVAAVMRLIPLEIPHYTEIGIPDRLLLQMVNTPDGLILVTGPTGAGKSTTIASYLHYLNTENDYPRHIITIEDPIEYLLPSNTCVIDQRELGHDTNSYDRGLRSALRQMPHIIFVGEMRDRSTMEIALTAAETGNLVISTLSTQSAAKTINRIIDVFPLDQQAEVRTRLALTLKMVISQVLLRRQDIDGRIAAREIMVVNSAIANLIREGKIHQVNNMIAGASSEGMSLLDDALIELYQEGIVDGAAVMARLQDPEKMKAVATR
jgi:twitching motility protein PilT